MTEGLRARKRRLTRIAIQRAALELALDTGDMHPTVEAIAARADVSPRTFFNYFPTRDAALVGDALELPDDIDSSAGDDVFAMLIDVALRTVAGKPADRDLVRLRREVMRQSPDLFGRRIALGQQFDKQLIELAIERSRDDGAERPEDRGRIAALVVMAAARAGWARWIDSEGEETLEAAMRSTFDELRRMAGALAIEG